MFLGLLGKALIVFDLLAISSLVESYQNSLVNVRLVDGTSERNGRVELYWGNQWKAVCDDGWDQAEAITVCSELEYLNSNVRAIAVTGSHFGDAQEIHQLKQWNCRSSDTSLAYCGKTIALSPCSPSETAGVYCQGTDSCEDGEVRLMNGSTISHYEGRVEICFNGVWGTICSDDWDSREATVVCSQLGISAGQLIGIAVSSSEFYGEGEGPILLDRINCGENDTRLADCARFHLTPGTVGDHCTHRKDAGVICRGSSNCNDGEIRLINGGRSQTEGIVEICFGGVWGTICHDGWDDSDAKVACRQLRYSQGYVMMNVEYDREAHTIRHLSHVSCTGNESRLADCSHEGIGVHTCGENSNENAAVKCIAPPQTTHFYEWQDNSTTTNFIKQVLSKNSSTVSPSLTRNQILIIIGCIGFSAVLVSVLFVAPTAVVFYVRKRRGVQLLSLRIKKSSTQQDAETPVYEEIPTSTLRQLTDEEPSCAMDDIKTEQNVVYETSSATITTSNNEAYGQIIRLKL